MTIYLYTINNKTYKIDTMQSSGSNITELETGGSTDGLTKLESLQQSSTDLFTIDTNNQISISGDKKKYNIVNIENIGDQAIFYFDDRTDSDEVIDNFRISPKLQMLKTTQRDDKYEKEIIESLHHYIVGFGADSVLPISTFEYKNLQGRNIKIPLDLLTKLQAFGSDNITIANSALNHSLQEIHRIATAIRKHNPNSNDAKQIELLLNDAFNENYLLSKAFKDVKPGDRINYVLALDSIFSKNPAPIIDRNVGVNGKRACLLNIETLYTFNPNDLPRFNSPKDWIYYLNNIQSFGVQGNHEIPLRGIAAELSGKLSAQGTLDSADLVKLEGLIYYATDHKSDYKKLAEKVFTDLEGKLEADPLRNTSLKSDFVYRNPQPNITNLIRYVQSTNIDQVNDFLLNKPINGVVLGELYGNGEIQKELLKLIHEQSLANIFSGNDNFDKSCLTLSQYLINNRELLAQHYPNLYREVTDNAPNIISLNTLLGNFNSSDKAIFNPSEFPEQAKEDRSEHAHARDLIKLAEIDQDFLNKLKQESNVNKTIVENGQEMSVSEFSETKYGENLRRIIQRKISDKLSKIQIGTIKDEVFTENLARLGLGKGTTNIPLSIPALQREIRALGVNMEHYHGAINKAHLEKPSAIRNIAFTDKPIDSNLYFDNNDYWYDLFENNSVRYNLTA